ncbi:MAG: hypothetical protein WC943_17385 [Elusimicrobiota bacterium]|jgi:hypothetical protein
MKHLSVLLILTTASIFFVPPLVNAAQPAASPREKNRVRGQTLEAFIQQALTNGDDNDFGPNLSRILDLKPNHRTKGFERLREMCADDRDRSVDVVVEKVSDSEQLKPVWVIFFAKRVLSRATDSVWFKLRPDGSIEKALRSTGKITEDGHGVPGSGVAVDLDSDEARRLLKREFDFWLKGIGLKKKAGPAAPVKAAPSSKP